MGTSSDNYWRKLLSFFVHSYGKLMEILGLKAPGNYSASIWINKIPICLWENLETLISMISGFWDVSRPLKPILSIFGDTRTPKPIQEKHRNILKQHYFYKSQNVEVQIVDKFGKDARQQIPTIRLIKS